jgi:hypothetical protein
MIGADKNISLYTVCMYIYTASNLKIVVCSFVPFLLAIDLSVLRFTDSDYPFGVLKLFLMDSLSIFVILFCHLCFAVIL